MYKVAVIGDKDSILGFKALGIDAYSVFDGDEAKKTVDTLARQKYGIIFITEQMASLIPDTIKRYNNKLIPTITLIPSNQGTLNIGMDRISDNVEKAVGINIL